MNRRSFSTLIASALALLAAGPLHAKEAGDGRDPTVGAVYTMTNSPSGNAIVVLERDEQGALTPSGTVLTGGLGSGGALDPLGSQGSLGLADNHRWLLAANAGSNDISVFRVSPRRLELVDNIASGGVFPTSIAIFHDVVYVLNAGATPNVTGFTLNHQGHLAPISGSTRSLAPGVYSQVGIDPLGNALVLTHRSANRLLVYALAEDGRPAANPVASASHGLAPFSFAFTPQGILLVAEAGSNAVSSYDLQNDLTLRVVSGSIANGQTATCWITTAGPRFAFTANPGTSSLSSYRAQPGTGEVTLLSGVAGTGTRPLDVGTSTDNRFLYALDPGTGTIDAFRVEHNGALANLGATAVGLPLYAQGMAVR